MRVWIGLYLCRCLCCCLGVALSPAAWKMSWKVSAASTYSKTCQCMSCWTKTSWSRRCTKVTVIREQLLTHLIFRLYTWIRVILCAGCVYGLSYGTRLDEDNCIALMPKGTNLLVFACWESFGSFSMAAPPLPAPLSLCRTPMSVPGQRLIWGVGSGGQTIPIQLQDKEQIWSECWLVTVLSHETMKFFIVLK